MVEIWENEISGQLAVGRNSVGAVVKSLTVLGAAVAAIVGGQPQYKSIGFRASGFVQVATYDYESGSVDFVGNPSSGALIDAIETLDDEVMSSVVVQ